MKIVLDTNVLVSGLLFPYGVPGEIVRMVASATLELCHDARILGEYREVLLRPKFSFRAPEVENFLSQIENCGFLVSAVPLRAPLPDPYDEPFLEAAIAGKARCLVTGNTKHYPVRKRQDILVLSPAKFLEFYRLSQQK